MSEHLLSIGDRPVITRGNMHAVSRRKWESLLANLLGSEPVVRLHLGGQWYAVRTVGDLIAFVHKGGRVW